MPSPAFKLYQVPATSGPIATKIISDFNRTVVAEIADPTGVDSVEWSIFGANRSDKLLPTLTPRAGGLSVEVDTPSDADGLGRGWGLRCTINNGKNPSGRNEPGYSTTAGIWIANSDGFYPCFFGETFEFDSVVGWARLQPYLHALDLDGDVYGPALASQVKGIQGAAFEDGLTLSSGRTFFRHSGVLYQVGNVDFGAGEDGDIVVGAGNVTLSRDTNYRNVSFNSGHTGKIITNGYTLRIVVLDMANANSDAIVVSNSTHGSGATPGTGSLGGWLPRGMNGVGVNASVGAADTRQGGQGGSAGTAAANTANTRTAPVSTETVNATQPIVSNGLRAYCGHAGASSTVEGASGAGGGWMQLYVGILLNNGTCATGAISSKGGNGSAATTSAGGGGGGGGGGVIDFRCALSLGDPTTDLLNCDGGSGGAVTTIGKPTGAGGEGGHIHYQVCNSRTVVGIAGIKGRVDGAAGTTGTTASTAARAGGACRVTI